MMRHKNVPSKLPAGDYGLTCPDCGGEEFTAERSYENSDADGNRGIWLWIYTCTNCGWSKAYND